MSPWAARPLFIAFMKEGRETMIPFFRHFLDPEVHLLTHYSSSPAWDGTEFCLWSPRGRKVVMMEECSVLNIQRKTVIRNPLKIKLEVVFKENELEEVSRKRKHSPPVNLMPKSEAARRFEAYKYMVERGMMEGLEVVEDHMVSVDCDTMFCDHTDEEGEGCSLLCPTKSKLLSVLETFQSLIS